MLKIVLVETTDGAAMLRLEGRVIGPWVEELRRSCQGVLTKGARLTLDLSDVSFVDRDGVGLFRSLMGHHVALVNGSSFIREQLKAGGSG